jgi:dUTP pyrophosphatase
VKIISSGIAVEIPEKFFGMLTPRSGLAIKNGITLLNSPGIIDADYRGEIKIVLINHSNKTFTVKHGDRIAQLIIVPFASINWIESQNLTQTDRGIKGFGSTGMT